MRKLASILFFILFISNIAFSQATQINIKKEFPVLRVENDVWIGTPTGLYQYKGADDSYKLYSIPGKENCSIKYLYYNNDWLWCVLDSGLAVLQIKVNQWMVFDKNRSLPSNNVKSIAFQNDYVWVATDNGAVRFDQLIEEWETYGVDKGIPDSVLVKILVVDNLVWFVTKNGYSEYNPQFEKWRHFQVSENEDVVISDAFLLGGNMWMVCNRGLIKFNPQLNSQQYFFNDNINSENLLNIAFEENAVWTLSKNGLYYIETESQVLKEFEGNYYLKDYTLKNFNFDSNETWFLTDKNVLNWNRNTKSWKIIDYASGVSDSTYFNAFVSGGMTFLITNQSVDYKLTADGVWKKYEFVVQENIGGSYGRNLYKNLLDNEKGGFVKLGKNQLKLDGTRANYIYEKSFDGKVNSGERLDVKSQLTLGESRSIYGFYNNVDYSETMYGIKYKSVAQKDVVREVNLGDFRRDPGTVPFAENASVFGANTWLQAGKKTERFKRSMFSAKAMSGQLRSRKEFEYYQGANTKFSYSIKDLTYVRNSFFALQNLPLGSTPEKIEIFLDNGISSDNNKNTAKSTIANIVGDFDLLIPTEDYFFHSKSNSIRLNKMLTTSASLVVRYEVNGKSFEEVLYANGMSAARQNIYFLNAESILPNSLKVVIRDTLGQEHSLSEFGLDTDGDGRIDPENVDFEKGYLLFSNQFPFPLSVYEPKARSVYSINVSYDTKRSILKLKHKNLVRGTEMVILDGVAAVKGSDYVLDYTNGTLVFVKEGIVNIDTRIELEYEYYQDDENDMVHSAALNFSPSDNFYIQTDYLNFKKPKTLGNDTAKIDDNDSISHLATVHTEFRNKIKDKVDVKLITGAAYQAEKKEISGEYVEGLVSTSKFRVQSKYTNYEKSYSNLFEPQSIIGKTKNSLQLYSSADLVSFLKLTGEWKKDEAFNEISKFIPNNKQGNYSMLLHKENLPSWQVSYQDINTNSDTSKIKKYSVGNKFEYQLPQKIVSAILLKNMKLEADYRQGEQSGQVIAGTDKQRFNQQLYRVSTNFADQIAGSFFYKKNDYFDNSANADKEFLSRNERVLINFSQEQWRVLQFNLTMENILDQNRMLNKLCNSAKITKYSQANFRFSPGQIWNKLNILFFEFNANQSVTSWGEISNPVKKTLWQVYNSKKALFDYTQLINNYYVNNELRPNSKIIFYSLYEWNRQNNFYGKSALSTNFERWSEKAEFKINYNLRLILQFKKYNQNLAYGRVYKYNEPSTWIEHRWNNNLQDMINLQYRMATNRYRNMLWDTDSWMLTYNIIWRKDKFLRMDKIEIRNDISATITNTQGDNQTETYLYSTNTSLDIYPFTAAIFRLQFQYKQNDDMYIEENSYSNIAYNFKFILKF